MEGPTTANRSPVPDHAARACAAPHVAMYLDPAGLVTACCANSAYVLGRIHRGDHTDSLTSIWHGARTASLRSAVDVGDLSLGCHECAAGTGAGRAEHVLAREFDKFWPSSDGDYPSYIDFALSNTCNLQCVMCNGDLSSAIRTRREGREPLRSPYDDRFFAELAQFLPHLLEASFKGGEPFLSSEARRVWDLLIELDHPPRVSVTTNGTVWNDRVEHYLRALSMDVSISVDGSTAATVESIRVGATHRELRANIDRFHAVTAECGGSLVLNYCLMPQNYRELASFLLGAEHAGLAVHVVEVTAPADYDVIRLPLDRLESVLRHLERQSAEMEDQLEINQETWRTQVERIRSAVAVAGVDRRHASAVELRPRRDPGSIRAALTSPDGASPIEVELELGVVRAVRSAPWADELLAPASWIGVGDHDLLARIADSLGATYPEVLTEDHGDGTMSSTVTFDVDGGLLVMNAVVLIDDRSGRPRRLVIGPMSRR